MKSFSGRAAAELKGHGEGLIDSTSRRLSYEEVACLGRVEDYRESRGPMTDVHQTKLEMKEARCSESAWLGYDWVTASLGSLFHFFAKVAKTTMNISEQEINKSRINIYAPKGM